MKALKYNTDKKTVFNTCKKVLIELKCEITVENFEQGIIEVKKPGSFFAYGHKIKIEINNIELNVKSDTLGIQIIDWGTNTENEEDIIEKIAALLK